MVNTTPVEEALNVVQGNFICEAPFTQGGRVKVMYKQNVKQNKTLKREAKYMKRLQQVREIKRLDGYEI